MLLSRLYVIALRVECIYSVPSVVTVHLFPSSSMSPKAVVNAADEALLATLGYKQEFKRAFTPLEVRFLPSS